MSVTLRVRGADTAKAYLAKLREGAAATGTTRVFVGTPVFYGRFVERGTRRMPARPFIGPSVAEIQRELPDAVLQAIERGEAPVQRVIAIANRARSRAAAAAPVYHGPRRPGRRPGTLRRSMRVVVGGRAR